jgi:O-antigen ligase
MIYRILNNIPRLQLSDFGIIWILFFSVFYQKLAPVGFALILISLFFKRNVFIKQEFKETNFKSPLLWFIFYYLLLLVGMLWSENTAFGLSKLENKLTFLLFPILYLLSNRKLGNSDWKKIFIFSLVFTLVIYELTAFVKTLFLHTELPANYFMESRFTVFMHRSYFSCYLVIGTIFLIENIRKQFNFWSLLLIVFFAIGTYQTGSKAGFLSLLIIIIAYAIIFILKKAKKYFIISFSFMLITCSAFLFTNNVIKSRFETTWSALNNFKVTENPSIESNTARIIMWNTSWNVWQEQFIFGTGTGDYDDALTKKNIDLGNTGVAKERLNAHNQFLNTGVQLGLIGFLILAMIFISAWLYQPFCTWRNLILIVFFINFLVESFLETQAGIVLFCVLLTLFFTPKMESNTSN